MRVKRSPKCLRALMQRTGPDGSGWIWLKTTAVVDYLKLQLTRLRPKSDEDLIGRTVPDGIGNSLPHHLLKLVGEPWDINGELPKVLKSAGDAPLFSLALGERLQPARHVLTRRSFTRPAKLGNQSA
jgi:hypothetical protein